MHCAPPSAGRPSAELNVFGSGNLRRKEQVEVISSAGLASNESPLKLDVCPSWSRSSNHSDSDPAVFKLKLPSVRDFKQLTEQKVATVDPVLVGLAVTVTSTQNNNESQKYFFGLL
jgi:hypothetical protein